MLKGKQLEKFYKNVPSERLLEKVTELQNSLKSCLSSVEYIYRDDLFFVKRELKSRGIII